jgi:hypothetical protein
MLLRLKIKCDVQLRLVYIEVGGVLLGKQTFNLIYKELPLVEFKYCSYWEAKALQGL